jgi:ComF family protein
LIQLIKYHGRPTISVELGKELALLASQEFPGLVSEEDTLVTFVPIDQERWRERGFDQAKILAQSTAEHLKLKYSPTIERQKSVSPQTRLSASQRRRNLRGVFSILKPESVPGKNVLLVDDVLTTGSTVSACSRVLKQAGAKSVCVLTICHTVVQISSLLGAAKQNQYPI